MFLILKGFYKHFFMEHLQATAFTDIFINISVECGLYRKILMTPKWGA